MTKQEMIKRIQRKERMLHSFKEFDMVMIEKGENREYWEKALINDSREWFGVRSLMMELGIKPERKSNND